MDLTKPIRLLTSRAWRTYHGGKMISALHGEEGEDGHFPEEWLMSTVAARNVGREEIVEGVSTVAENGMPLDVLVEQEALHLLGAAHVEKYGKSLGVLVKLLDSAERLGVQVHPTREVARRLFDSAYGKTECWHIVDGRTINGEEPCIYLGFKAGVTREKWKECFDTQNIPEMLSCLHKIPVKKGDTYIVHGGVPHAIGAGCFLVEIQEPTDYTIRTERVTPGGLAVADAACHQGIGFEKMFDCFTYGGASAEENDALYKVTPIREERDGCAIEHIIYPAVTDMFALDLITVTREATFSDDSFYGIYVMAGSGSIDGAPLSRCDHFLVPAACDRVTVKADDDAPLTLLRFFGPK